MITVYSSFGHEIFACAVAKMLHTEIEVASRKENPEEARADKAKIASMLQPFGVPIRIVPEGQMPIGRDIVSELKAGTLPAGFWDQLAGTKLPIGSSCKRYPILERAKAEGKRIIGLVPEKTLTDGQCGLTAAQQSLNINVFEEIIDSNTLYGLLQHYDKTKMDGILDCQKWVQRRSKLYVPGQEENPEVLGIRGVPHVDYFNMYAQLDAIVGIAGTHFWLALFAFPEIAQIILYNRKGFEPMETIAAAWRKKGFKIYVNYYDDNSDKKKLAHEIAETYKKLW